MSEIRSYPVPPESAAIWWLGQNGYIFKSPEGTLASVDLYLTDSCGRRPSNKINLSRRVPVLIEPEELEVDLFACTHNHQDHTDPETISRLRIHHTSRFVGPPPSCGVFRAQGVDQSRITMAWPQCEIEFRDLRIFGTFAVPTSASDLNHMGFVFAFGGGPRIYVTGDTDDHPLVASAAQYAPDLMIVCINGGFNNLSHWEAAELAARIRPKAVIPCHYDLFPDNSLDPRQFEAALLYAAPEVRYLELHHGRPLVFQK